MPRRPVTLPLTRPPRTGTVIVEDAYDSEFRYSRRPVSALQGLDRHGHTVFTGSFSKALCPSLRLGYLVVPAPTSWIASRRSSRWPAAPRR